MRAKEIMGTVDENGQISLDTPLTVDKHSRVKVVVLFMEEEIYEDDDNKKSILDSLHTSLQEAKTGKTKPVSELWDGLMGELITNEF